MKVFAKCHNYAGCLQAYRGEDIELDAGAPLVCPECGKPLTIIKPPAPAWLRALPAVLVLALIGLGVWALRPFLSGFFQSAPPPKVSATPTPGRSPTAASPSESLPVTTPAPVVPESHEPPTTVITPEHIDLDLAKAENQKVKREVLTRIDLMPSVSQANKDKLYNSVERARSMGKVMTIPFGSGKITLGAAEVQALKANVEDPQVMKLREDPTAVFVILGYADPKGDEKKNIAISQARADAVLEAMRDKCGIMNVMHAVAMGGSTLMDTQVLEKNRIVEVWAVLP